MHSCARAHARMPEGRLKCDGGADACAIKMHHRFGPLCMDAIARIHWPEREQRAVVRGCLSQEGARVLEEKVELAKDAAVHVTH